MLKRFTSIILILLPLIVLAGRSKILDQSSVKGGLITYIGCDNPSALAGLLASGAYLVHGLDTDAGKVLRAHKYLSEKKLYGRITVGEWDGKKLPYVDNMVNLLVIANQRKTG